MMNVDMPSLLFPAMRSDAMETINHHNSMKWSFFASIILCFAVNASNIIEADIHAYMLIQTAIAFCIAAAFTVLFYAKVKPTKYNLRISEKSLSTMTLDMGALLLTVALSVAIFLWVYPSYFPFTFGSGLSYVYLALSSYFYSSLLSLFLSGLFINVQRIFWLIIGD